ncbi:MAG: hypothetical protein JSU72_18590, partial [Deltaproteobacteria bacterium]
MAIEGGKRVRLPQVFRWRWNVKPPVWVGLILVLPLLVALGLFVAYPLVKLILDSLEDGGIRNYLEFFQVRANVRVLYITFRVSAIV